MHTNEQNDSLRVTHLVQDYHPIIRRRAFTSIRTSFPTFFSQQQKQVTPSMNQSQKIIAEQYNKIHNIIDLVDQHIRRRIQCYQNQVVSVVQKQIQQMREETHKVVEQFNQMILQKNKENQIWSLNNELDYFKSQAKKLFDQCKIMKKENLQFKKKIQQYQWELQNREVIMQKLLYKYQKEKHHKEKIKRKMNLKMQDIQKKTQQLKIYQNPEILEFNEKENSFEMPQLKFNSIKLISPQKQRHSGNVEQESQKFLQSNSIVVLDYDQCESSISFNAKSINITQIKPDVKDQSSQANIYLSEHQYKSLFENKIQSKKVTKQIGIQVQNQNQRSENKLNLPNKADYSMSVKEKQINFTKHGFYVNDINNKGHQRYRSQSNNYNKTLSKMQSTNCIKSKQHIITQPSFNKSINSESIRNQLRTVQSKQLKIKNKFHYKMATKFEHNKIVGRAYSRQKFNSSYKN